MNNFVVGLLVFVALLGFIVIISGNVYDYFVNRKISKTMDDVVKILEKLKDESTEDAPEVDEVE